MPSVWGVNSKHDNDALRIGGIDPGLASGGFVVIDARQKNRVLASHSLVEPKGAAKAATEEARELAEEFGGWGDVEFIAAALRAERWVENFTSCLAEVEAEFGPITYFAVESFVDQRSRAREENNRLIRNRWQTPFLMGQLAVALHGESDAFVRNRRIVYQNAGTVIRQWGPELAELKQRGRGKEDLIVSGDGQVGNDHERKALVHALALSLRLSQQIRDDKPLPHTIETLSQERN